MDTKPLPDELSSQASTRSRFIDLCRGVAILAVIFHHYYFTTIVRFQASPNDPVTASLLALNNGWLGVNLFFILSGLLLYDPAATLGWRGVTGYYLARARRLLPLYFIFIFFAALISGRDVVHFVKLCLLLLSGLHDIIPSQWMPNDTLWVCWSLGVEILFSILLPVILLITPRVGFWRFFWGCIAFCFVYRIGADAVWFAYHPAHTNRFINPLADNIAGRIDDFVVGMAIARFTFEKRHMPPSLLPIAVVVLLATGREWNFVWMHERTHLTSVLASLMHVTFSLSVFVLILTLRDARIWNAVIWTPIAFAGSICYSAYFVHAALYPIFRVPDGGSGELHIFAEYVLLTLAISTVTFVFVESSGMRRLPGWALRILGRASAPASHARAL